MQGEAVDRMKSLVHDAQVIRGLREWYERETSSGECWEYEASFGMGPQVYGIGDVVPVQFSCVVQHPGGTARPPRVQSASAVASAFLRALNEHKWLILETMADYLLEDAGGAVLEVEKEVAGAQALLDSVRKETEDEDAVEGGRA